MGDGGEGKIRYNGGLRKCVLVREGMEAGGVEGFGVENSKG